VPQLPREQFRSRADTGLQGQPGNARSPPQLHPPRLRSVMTAIRRFETSPHVSNAQIADIRRRRDRQVVEAKPLFADELQGSPGAATTGSSCWRQGGGRRSAMSEIRKKSVRSWLPMWLPARTPPTPLAAKFRWTPRRFYLHATMLTVQHHALMRILKTASAQRKRSERAQFPFTPPAIPCECPRPRRAQRRSPHIRFFHVP
jgi:hypothetical protein